MEDLIWSLVPVLVFALFFSLAIVSAVRKGKSEQNKASQQKTAPPKTAQKNARQPAKTKTAPRHTGTIDFGDEHTHGGDEVEEYEKIVGSLGEVADEGCPELNGLRLISNDKAYMSEEEGQYDLNKTAAAMILGEVLGQPRCKKPYKR